MRLNKFLALGTGMARRKADEAIKKGEVWVNAKVGVLGMDVKGEDWVEWRGVKVELPRERVVVALNKPEEVIVSHERQTPKEKIVFDLLPEKWQDLRFVGRLDRETCGLLLFTNDGKLNEELTHPRFGHEKEYVVESEWAIEIEQVARLNEGVELSDGMVCAREVVLVGPKKLSLVLMEGRKRIVRRMCSKVGIRIEKLERVRMGGLKLRDLGLKRGEVRELTEKEVRGILG